MVEARDARADIRVGIIMGSQSDQEVMRRGAEVLDELGIGYEMVVCSAHRNPERTAA
jgi:phosphoribosylcarboxyaminoimidazole (NCAIR) mutase